MTNIVLVLCVQRDSVMYVHVSIFFFLVLIPFRLLQNIGPARFWRLH